jgi:ribonuclease P protein component
LLGDAVMATQQFSFNRLYRLCLPAEFRRVFQQATRSGDHFFTVLWRENDHPTARIGFAIAKKQISLAVGRNRVRRLARESFRHQRSNFPGVDIVLLAKAAAGKASNEQLLESLEKHWLKIQQATSSHKNVNRRKDNRLGDRKA